MTVKQHIEFHSVWCLQVIQEGQPCHLYFDLEFNIDCNPALQGDAMVDSLLSLVAEGLRYASTLKLMHIEMYHQNRVPPIFSPCVRQIDAGINVKLLCLSADALVLYRLTTVYCTFQWASLYASS